MRGSFHIIKLFTRSLALLVSALSLIVLSVSGVDAQSIFPPRLDLDGAIEKALADNPQTRISTTKLKIADAKIAAAKSGKLPSAQFTQSAVGSNNPVFVFGSLLEQGRFGPSNFAIDSLNNPSGLVNMRTLISGQVPIFDQRQTRSRVTQAETGKKQTELQAEYVRQNLRFEVIRTYYSAVLGRELLKVSQEAVLSARANRKKTGDMVEVGMTTEADSLAAEVELANADQQKLEADNNFTITLASLNLMLGYQPETEFELSGALTEKYFPIDDQNELLRIAFENRPDYLSAELAILNGREQSRAIRDQRLPRVDAFGNFGYSSPYLANGSSDYTVGVNLTYTIFDPGRKARITEAVENQSLAELEKEDLGNKIRLEVIRAVQNYKTARSRIQVSIKSISQSDEALRIIQDRYKFGLTTFNEVLRAESALVRSKHNLLSARYDYYVSYASVLLATGTLSDARVFN